VLGFDAEVPRSNVAIDDEQRSRRHETEKEEEAETEDGTHNGKKWMMHREAMTKIGQQWQWQWQLEKEAAMMSLMIHVDQMLQLKSVLRWRFPLVVQV